MDKLIYTAMSGANRSMLSQQVHANNLANVNTTGFRADYERARSYAVGGDGLATRHMAVPQGTGSKFAPGPLENTGNELDIGIRGEGMLAVQVNGQERYTRAGAMHIDENGILMMGQYPVLDMDGQQIEIPDHRSLNITEQGRVSVVPDSGGEVLLEVATLKRVKPELTNLVKDADGFFQARIGNAPLPADDSVPVASGFLEASNVNPVEEMVAILNTSRQFELQVKMMKTAEELSQASTRLIRPA
ncbi:FlgF family flagellar basal-body rod protein [Buttiauxella ferragutiae ATCC 51602]|jgi:flagellar basal-body rod protein FlgF|uniref:Flagellar basal-body rod protein FlgF n=1 Tax=Buttiauxella ferragutiae ATCC 51602 TaxID=1354252 RepID=A0ABX2W8V0_9ENTR|nr:MULTISPECIES: flagellar basal-body rod protein FlgF [Buttiauxella]OAT28104.1 FlgF family flagellar basal-body rod protein [Buttiauxella ferragutiae ATCC 51602]TDN49808.1 flagellar basal-body rod protein FlgF [Buttiauxella sp. JUb87]